MTAKCFWITGLAGAGKTTIAAALVDELKTRGVMPVVLDGDELRNVFGNRLGYQRADRLILAMSYARLCQLLVSQGFTVVIATISLFHEVHRWNRENIPGYFEIFLDVPQEVLHRRDQKGLYSAAQAGQQDNVAGVTEVCEFPQAADAVLHNDGSRPAAELVDELFTLLGQADGL